MKNILLASLALTLLGLTTACEEPEESDNPSTQPGDPEPNPGPGDEPTFDEGAYLVTPVPSMGEFAHRIEPVDPSEDDAVGIVDGIECLVGLWAPGSCEQTYTIERIDDCVHTMEVGGEAACADLYDVIPVDYSEGTWGFVDIYQTFP